MKESIGSKAQKKTNKILNFDQCGFDTHKNASVKNLVILFVFFCDFEPIDSFF